MPVKCSHPITSFDQTFGPVLNDPVKKKKKPLKTWWKKEGMLIATIFSFSQMLSANALILGGVHFQLWCKLSSAADVIRLDKSTFSPSGTE